MCLICWMRRDRKQEHSGNGRVAHLLCCITRTAVHMPRDGFHCPSVDAQLRRRTPGASESRSEGRPTVDARQSANMGDVVGAITGIIGDDSEELLPILPHSHVLPFKLGNTMVSRDGASVLYSMVYPLETLMTLENPARGMPFIPADLERNLSDETLNA